MTLMLPLTALDAAAAAPVLTGVTAGLTVLVGMLIILRRRDAAARKRDAAGTEATHGGTAPPAATPLHGPAAAPPTWLALEDGTFDTGPTAPTAPPPQPAAVVPTIAFSAAQQSAAATAPPDSPPPAGDDVIATDPHLPTAPAPDQTAGGLAEMLAADGDGSTQQAGGNKAPVDPVDHTLYDLPGPVPHPTAPSGDG